MEPVKVTIQSGDLSIKNVPHYVNEFIGPNGEEFSMSMGVARNLSLIAKHMREHNLTEFDYEGWSEGNEKTNR